MKKLQAKKYLGQHFLNNDEICHRIAHALTLHKDYQNVLEVGPGMGALTSHLLNRKDIDLIVVEVDPDSREYLRAHLSGSEGWIVDKDFLKMDLNVYSDEPIGIVGNFPYSISTQILFKALENKGMVMELVGMFQKEVAERVCSGPGSKKYGILSVLLQAFYDMEYLFTVEATEFIPPPKVQSGVIRMKRNEVTDLGCDEKRFKQVIKMGFNQRRKTLRNSLKPLLTEFNIDNNQEIFTKRPEQ